VGVGEEDTALGETVDIRSPCVRMTPEATNPVIEVVDRDEEYVGLVGRRLGGGGRLRKRGPQGASGPQTEGEKEENARAIHQLET
jgi:hypothetical protein